MAYIQGTVNNDTLTGTAQSDEIYGLAGNDSLLGQDGSDYVDGGNGNDTVKGGLGSDAVYGEGGNDSLLGEAGIDDLSGGEGNDTLNGGEGDDFFFSDAGSDSIIGGIGDDYLTLYLSAETASLTINYADINNGTVSNGISFKEVENITTNSGSGNDSITGGAFSDDVGGGNGNDTIKCGLGNDGVSGDGGNDSLLGEAGIDDLSGGEGNDSLDGGLGNDYLSGGEGNDTLNGGEDDDYLYGENGNDSILGDAGNDYLDGAAGNDTLDGRTGNDTLTGGLGNDIYRIDNLADVVTETSTTSVDTLESPLTNSLTSYTKIENLTLIGTNNIDGTGDSGNNYLTGNSGNNRLDGGLGVDTLKGGAGNDTYVKDTTSDSFIEGSNEGIDTIETNLTLTLTSYTNIENLTLTGSDNVNGTGDAGNNQIAGNSGNNLLTGGDGNDTLNGGLGIDTLAAGLGNDTYIVDTTTDVITEAPSEGTDTVNSSITFSITSLTNLENIALTGTGAISATGNAGNNSLSGNSGNNLLTGGDGEDTLDGGLGIDTLEGGLGNDSYVVDITTDVITEAASEGTDTVNSSVTLSLASLANLENITLTGGAAISAAGNTGDNRLTGNSGNNQLIGGDGSDTLDGGLGIDTLVGGLGNDSYIVDTTTDVITEAPSEGTDIVNSSVTFSIASLANLENITLTGGAAISATGNTGDNRITGNTGNNQLTGGEGSDTLDGGLGIDSLTGGLGNDTYIVDTTTDVITEAPSEGIDIVNSSVTFNLANLANIENLTLTGSDNLNGTGDAGNNSIAGNSGNNLLTGGDGEDTLEGGNGLDTLVGGLGNDSYIVDTTTDAITEAASGGTDTVNSSVTFTIATLANVENITLTGTSAIGATGNTGNNLLTGNTANNTLSGGAGNDTLNGGAGSDIIGGGTGNDRFVFAFGQSLATGRDRVSDFAIGSDQIDLLTNLGSEVSIPTSLSRAADSTASDLFVLAGQVFADSDGALSGNQPLGINSAALAVVTSGSATGTYVIVNNNVAGFQSSQDLLINITGYTGTLPGFGSVAPTTLFAPDSITPTLSVSNLTVVEGNTTTADFVLTLSNPTTSAVTVQYTTSDGTATGGSDYTSITSPLTVTLAANETIKTVSVTLLNDSVNEADEIFTLNLSNPTNTVLGNQTATATITDTLTSSVSATLPALVENLTLTGSANVDGTANAGNNFISGNSSNNLLSGLDGNDTLDGGLGIDTLVGGLGNDSYVIDTTTDVLTEVSGGGIDTVNSSVTYTIASGTNLENLTLTGTAVISATGNSSNNFLTGNTANNTVNAGGGNDTLNGGASSDILSGGTGNDVFEFAFSQSLATGRDRVSDFAIGTDKIDLLTNSGGAVATPTSLSRAADSTASDLFVLAGQVFADSDGALTGNQALGINSAALAVVTSGSATGTYVIVNNTQAGFQSSQDLIVNITGYTGTLPALGSVAPSTLFV